MNMRRIRRQLSGLATVCVLWLASMPASTVAGQLTELPGGLQVELELRDLDGRKRSLDEFSGQVVLVNFWASWCTPCVREMPSIVRLQRALSSQSFAVIGVNVAEGERRAAAAAQRLGLDFLVLLDPDGDEFARWGGQVLPTTFLLDQAGRVRYVALGPLEWDDQEVIETVSRLFREAPGPSMAGG